MKYTISKHRIINEKKPQSFYGYSKMTEKQQKVIGKLWQSYSLAKQLDFSNCFYEYSHLIPKKLNNKFKVKILPALDDIEHMSYPPMGMSYAHNKKIEFNSIYEWANKTQWAEIFWHELAHLIDTYGVSYYLLEKTVISHAKKSHKLTNYRTTLSKKDCIKYYTKPDVIEGKRHYDRVIIEVFAEMFSLIMLLLTKGTHVKTIKCIKSRSKLIQIYYPCINILLKNIDFNKMGLQMSHAKKEKIKIIFKQIAFAKN
jgi:hypothetical protein